MNRPHTVQPPPRTTGPHQVVQHFTATTALAAGLIAVYGLGGLLEAVLTRAVVS